MLIVSGYRYHVGHTREIPHRKNVVTQGHRRYYTPDVFNPRADKVSSMLNVDDSSRVGIHDILHGFYHRTRCTRDEATSGVEARQTT